MDMKRILQALDTASTTPVEGANDMKKFVSIIAEAANPHKVSLPVQMAMQHYQEPTVQESVKPATPSLLKQYFAEAEAAVEEQKAVKKEKLKQYANTIAERVLMKESKKVAVEENQGAPRDVRTIQPELKAAEKHLQKVEYAHAKAREVTKEIKYDDVAGSIVLRIRALAEAIPEIDTTNLKYSEEAVFEAMRALESAVYGLEESFEDAVRGAKNKVDDLETEISEIQWQSKYGRPEA